MSVQTSVIIPCYNYGRFLSRAVNSVLDQTYQDFEIIIVDDHSTDNTFDVAQTLISERVRYIRQPHNVGQSENRNTAIRAACGEFIAMLDADDWFDKRYLERVVPQFNNQNVGLVYTFKQGQNEDGTQVPFSDQKSAYGKVTEQVFVSNFVGTPITFRKSLAGEGFKTDLIPEFNNLGVDWWFVLEISTKCEVVCIEEPLYNYYFHGNQMSNSNLHRRIKADRTIQEKFLQQYPNQISQKWLKEAKFWAFIREGYYQRQCGEKWHACLSYMKSCIIKPLSLIGYKGLISTIISMGIFLFFFI